MYVDIHQITKGDKRGNNHCLFWTIIYLHSLSLRLTFACLHTLVPPVTGVRVATTAAVFIPSAARSTTTDSTGFLERVTLWAHYLIGRGDS